MFQAADHNASVAPQKVDVCLSTLRCALVVSPNIGHLLPEFGFHSQYIPTHSYSRYKITVFFAITQILWYKYPFLGSYLSSTMR